MSKLLPELIAFTSVSRFFQCFPRKNRFLLLLLTLLMGGCGAAGSADQGYLQESNTIQVGETAADTAAADKINKQAEAAALSEIPAAISAIEIAPGAFNLGVGSSQQLVAIGRLGDGSAVNLFGQVSWSIRSGTSVAAVTAAGLLTRLAAGTADIQASALGKTAILKLGAAGLTLSYDNSKSQWSKVNIYLWDGADLKPEAAGGWPGTAMTASNTGNNIWTYVVEQKYLRNGAIRIIFNNGGGSQTGDLISAQSATYSNGAWLPATNRSTQVSVINGTIKDGTIKNSGSLFAVGSVLTINANSASSPFSLWSGTGAAYIFTDPSKAEAQLLVPDTVSSMTLQALYANSSSSANSSSVSSSPANPSLASLEIAPGSVNLNPGSNQQLVAIGRLSDGSKMNVSGQVTWSIRSGASAAAVTATGLLTRLAAGTAEIQASALGKTAILKLGAAGLTLSYDNSKSQWSKVNIYLWDGSDIKPESAGGWPGAPMTQAGSNIWTYVVEQKYLRDGAIKVIFNNGAGSQTRDLFISQSATYRDGIWLPAGDNWVQLNLINGTVKNGGSLFAAGSVLTINANLSNTPFSVWGGSGAAYIFTDLSKAEAQLLVPDGVSSMTLQAFYASSASSLINSSSRSSSLSSSKNSSSSSIRSSASSSVAEEDGFKATRDLFASLCAGCHGVNGASAALKLNDLHLSGKYTLATLTTKINDTMPRGNPDLCVGTAPGGCAYDIANMILANKWLPAGQTSSVSASSVRSSSSLAVSSLSSARSSSASSVRISSASVLSISSASSILKSSSTSSVLSSSAIASSLSVSSFSSRSSDPAALASIEIAPGALALSVGASQQLVAVGKLGNGSLVNLFGKVSWRISSGETVASVSASGLLKRLAAGSAVIEAVSQGKTASLTLASGDTQGITISYDNSSSRWAAVDIYLWTANGEVSKAWPGNAMTLSVDNVWTYHLDASKLSNGWVNVVFNNHNAGAQTGDLMVGESSVFKDGVWTPTGSPNSTMAQLAVIDGSVSGGGSIFASGSVLTINANASGNSFKAWGGASAAYIFTDPSKAQVQMVVPSGVSSLVLQALFNISDDPYKTARNFYAAQCVGCHGVNGSGGPLVALNNLHSSGKYPTVADLAFKIATSMPRGNVGTCVGATAGTCAYDLASMIMANQWLAPDTCTGTGCNANDSLDTQNYRLLTKEEYLNSVNDIFKETGVSFDATALATVSAETSIRNFKTASFLSLDYDRTLGYQMAAVAIAEKILAAKNFFALAGSCNSDTVCVINSLGKKIFRRPLTSAEVSRYLDLYDPGDAGRAVLQGLLISPHFLYRSEMGVLEPATGLYRLTPYEIASLLSYSLWASAPDDELLSAAAGANLDIAGQVTRMLADVRAERGLRRFAQGWLINNKYSYGAISSPSLAQAFDEETIRFVVETIKADLPYKTLLTATYTYANTELALYYKTSSVVGGWEKATFADSDPRRGAGLLGHGSFLASRIIGNDNPSPIKRGTFVRDVLMCQELPPPQKAALAIEKDPSDSNRDANARHTSDPGCQGCHQYIDGVGFGFESFASNALFRTTETLGNGVQKAIDASGSIKSLNSPETKLDPNSAAVPYQTVPQLANLIANSGQGAACYSRQFYRYVTGRNEGVADEKIIPVYSANLREGGGMKKMLVDLATNPSFVLRRQQ
ncbi:MAG TPA: starch-binding protein [Cellvibrio sp.]|nr:starch-binding protein [Cellvibrio sp.]